jgi:hypothetical protein
MEDKLLAQMRPLLRTCMAQATSRGAGRTNAVLSFRVTVAPNVGAVVHSVELEAGAIDAAFAQCIQESVGAIAPFDAGGPTERSLSIPLAFGGLEGGGGTAAAR